MIQDHSDHDASNKAVESLLRVDSSVPLIYQLSYHDPVHPKGLHSIF